MAYQPIQNYGLIGDLHTAALVGTDGSIDWLCFPSFDSPSVFGAILDDKKGGRFKISPLAENATYKQVYWPDTNVLITRFLSPDGVGEIADFMPVDEPDRWHGQHQLIRRSVWCAAAWLFACSASRLLITLEMTTGLNPVMKGWCFTRRT